MKSLNIITRGLIVAMVVTSIGCGQGFRVQGSGNSVGSNSTDISAELEKAESASKAAQQAMAEADQVIRTITDEKGNINLGLFMKSSSQEVQAAGILSPITDQLRKVFDTVFSKAEAVKAQFNAARASLADALGKLDVNNPVHAAAIEQIKAQLAKIDALEAQFKAAMASLASKLDIAVTALSGLISGATTFIPGWGSIIGLAIDFFVMSEVKGLIAELKARLLAL